MSELPLGWTYTTLGDVAGSGQYGWTTKAAEQGTIKFLRTTDITKRRLDWDSVPYCSEHPDDAARYILRSGDILVSRAGSVGFSALLESVPDRAVFASYLIRFLPNADVIFPRYLAHFLRSPSYWQQIADASAGIALANVNATKLAGVTVPLAPFREQKRIADKLDALLARVNACREHLDRVPGILKRFRQAVLAAATSGELTREWREGHGVVEEWEELPLEEIIESRPRNGYSPKAVEHATPVKSLTLTATTTGRFRGEHFKYIDELIPAGSHLWLRPGDILIQRANTLEYVGVSAIFDGPDNTFIYPDLMMKCRANQRVLPAFLHLVLSSQPVRRYFRENATGTAGNMPKINQQTVLSAPAVVPSIEEQRQIVARSTGLMRMMDALERSHKAALANVAKLAPSALAKAFRGELAQQDPNDEPASALLAKLKVT